MIELNGTTFRKLPLVGLILVRHLDEVDGPLLTQFRHPKGDNYLYYWCDCDGISNRWMVIRVSETNILRLVNRIIPLDRVVPIASLDDFVYFAETDKKGHTIKTTLVSLSDIPAEYKPRSGAYLDEAVERNPKSLAILIEESLSLEAFAGLPRIFSQAYGLLYAMLVLKPQHFEKIPWKDGFGGMQFYRSLLRLIPGEDRPVVGAMQYASPGFIRLSLDRAVADEVCRCVEHLKRDSVGVNAAYSKLYGYIKDKGLNKLKEFDHIPSDWETHNPQLRAMTRVLLTDLRIDDQDALMNAADPFEAAKIALSFVRRLRELRKFERDGTIRFPRINEPDSVSECTA